MIDFLWRQALLFLLIIPIPCAVYELKRRRLKKIVWSNYKPPSRIPQWLLMASIASLIVGTSRPVYSITIPITEVTVILAIDVSGSMEEKDIEPTRLDAAKIASKRFIDRLGSNARVGIVAFSENAALVQSPTFDKDKAYVAINRLESKGGTAIGWAILTSLEALKANSGSNSAIVLLTDGQNNVGISPLETTEYAQQLGVKVHTVGIGTQHSIAAENALDEGTLRKISSDTHGFYQKANESNTIMNSLDNLVPRLVMETQTTETSFVFSGVGLVLMIGSIGLAVWNG